MLYASLQYALLLEGDRGGTKQTMLYASLQYALLLEGDRRGTKQKMLYASLQYALLLEGDRRGTKQKNPVKQVYHILANYIHLFTVYLTTKSLVHIVAA